MSFSLNQYNNSFHSIFPCSSIYPAFTGYKSIFNTLLDKSLVFNLQLKQMVFLLIWFKSLVDKLTHLIGVKFDKQQLFNSLVIKECLAHVERGRHHTS